MNEWCGMAWHAHSASPTYLQTITSDADPRTYVLMALGCVVDWHLTARSKDRSLVVRAAEGTSSELELAGWLDSHCCCVL